MKLVIACTTLLMLAAACEAADWRLYEETRVKGSISGTIQVGSLIQMESGAIYEVAEPTLQLVLGISPDALVLSDGSRFKLIIKGFSSPVICQQLKASKTAHITLSEPPQEQPSEKAASPDAATQTAMQQAVDAAILRLAQNTNINPSGAEAVRSNMVRAAQLRLENQLKLLQDPEYFESLKRAAIASNLAPVFANAKSLQVRAAPGETVYTPLVPGVNDQVVQSTSAEPAKTTKSLAIAEPVTLGPQRKIIESRVDGEFNGWSGETAVKLENGQIWQQSEYVYAYKYAYRPPVLVYPSDGKYKMKVEGMDEAVPVKRLK